MNWLLTVFLILSTGCSTPKKTDKKYLSQMHLNLGSSFLSQGNYPAALRELLIAKRYNPENPVIFNNLGLAYLVRTKYKLAAESIQEALRLEPNFTEARNNLGRVLIHTAQYDQAIEQLKIAVSDLTYPEPEKSHSNLGIAYFEKGEFENALKHLKKSLHIRRNACVTLTFYGRTQLELQQLELAEKSLENSLVHCDKEKYYDPRYYGALASLKLGNIPNSIAKFEEVITLAPESEIAEQSKEMLALIKRTHHQ